MTMNDGSQSSSYASCLDELHLFLLVTTEERGVVHALRQVMSPDYEQQLMNSSRLQLLVSGYRVATSNPARDDSAPTVWLDRHHEAGEGQKKC